MSQPDNTTKEFDSKTFFAELTEKLRNEVDTECIECGVTFRGTPDTRCSQCHFYTQCPELKPGNFRWASNGTDEQNRKRWQIEGHWIWDEMPQPGAEVTVYRRDGTTSEETIQEFIAAHYDRAANWTVVCSVVERRRR
jgi:hypothetical protein